MPTLSCQSFPHVHRNFKEHHCSSVLFHHCKNIHSSWRYTPNIHLRKIPYFLSWVAFQTHDFCFGFYFVDWVFLVVFSLKGTLPLLKQITPFHSALSMTILHTKMVLSLHNEMFCWCPETHLQERVYSELGFYTKIIIFIFPLPHSCCWLQAQDETLAEAGSEIQTLNITLFI